MKKDFEFRDLLRKAGDKNLAKGLISLALKNYKESNKFKVKESMHDINPSQTYSKGLAKTTRMSIREQESQVPIYELDGEQLTGQRILEKLNKDSYLLN